ncbi:MAG: threonine/serine exporter family protein [Rothia sp. (in: high G+C Gram-positive bacteria)]|nr:threonine/serine exporter family protein [Rothia sp. (in: high G+C Gram-positive bacteria)]
MPDNHQTYEFMILVGDSLIRSGASSASTTRTLLAIANAEGIHNLTVSVTLGQLTLSAPQDDNGTPFTAVHEVSPGVLDIGWRSTTEEVVADYLLGNLTLYQAHHTLQQRVDKVAYPQWYWVAGGFAFLGAGFSFLLGADWVTMVGAAVTSLIVSTSFQHLEGMRFPGIFRFAIAGLLAVLISTMYCSLTNSQDVAVCIVSALAGQLAGIAAYGATQDAMMGWYLSATGRLLETLMSTAGLVSGVSVGIGIARRFVGEDVHFIEHLSSAHTPLINLLIGAGFVTGGFSLACGGRGIKLLSLMGLGIGAVALHYVVSLLPISDYSALTSISIAVGAVAVVVSKPVHLTSNAIMMLVLLPLIPGMMIYQGMLGTLYGQADALKNLGQASVQFYCLSVGGTTGQFILSELLWLARKRQFQRRYPEGVFDKMMIEESNAQDVILPVFSRPFNKSRTSR